MNIYGNCCRPSSTFTTFTEDDLNPIDMVIDNTNIRFEPLLSDGIFTLANGRLNDNRIKEINDEIKYLEEEEKIKNEKIKELKQKIKIIQQKISSMNKMLEIDICERDYIIDFLQKHQNQMNNITQSYNQN